MGCWSEYSHAEVLDMHGVDFEEYYRDDEDYDVDVEEDEEEEVHCCGNCMDCLGLSERDF
jgi:hypothetical protein